MASVNGKAEAEDLSKKQWSAEGGSDSAPPASNERGDSVKSERNQTTLQEDPASSADAELQKVKAERDNLLDRLARLQAEFENARKRSVREQQDFRDFALADAIKTLLPVVDSFERALQVSAGDQSEIRSGIELIYKQFQDSLAKLGLTPVPAKGETFDPHLHEAIEMVDTEEAPDHEVIEELQRGYKLKDRLLRPSMVKVARSSRR
jgi:molecular chaperone GrpE